MEFIPVTMPYKDAQFLESRQFQMIEICQIFGVPPHKVYNLTNATFSNIEHQTIEFVNDTLIPRVRAWETELNSKMFFASDRGKYYVKFNLQGLLRGDTATRATFYSTMTRIGVLSINEVRAFEDLPKLDDPAADMHLVQGQMTPIDQLGNPINQFI
jgi:HK97 family phage portal protein